MGPLRWPLCKNALGLEEMGERQQEWPHEAQARFALVVPPQRPRPGRRGGSGHGQRAHATGPPAPPPNSRMGQVRASERPPAPRRPGRHRPVWPTGRNVRRPHRRKGGFKVVRWPAPAPAKRASTAPSWLWLVSYYGRQLPQVGFPNPRVGVAAWRLASRSPLMAAAYAIDSADGLRGPRFSAAAGP